MNFIHLLAGQLGVAESSLRLLMALILAYPTAYIYRLFFLVNDGDFSSENVKNAADKRNSAIRYRHLYNALTGLVLSCFMFGQETWHLIVIVIGNWIMLKWLGGNSFLTLPMSWIWNLAYLLLGYFIYDTGSNGVDWTTGGCVLCLRMVGFAYDFCDGCNNRTTIRTSKVGNKTRDDKEKENDIVRAKLATNKNIDSSAADDQKLSTSRVTTEISFTQMPNLLEMFGFSFFPTSFLIGPQFPYMTYDNFIHLKSFKKTFKEKSSENEQFSKTTISQDLAKGLPYSFQCFAVGLFYVFINALGTTLYPSTFEKSASFLHNSSWWYRVWILNITSWCSLSKYLAVWTLNEGSCVMIGIAFNGYERIRSTKSTSKMNEWTPRWNAVSKRVLIIIRVGILIIMFGIVSDISSYFVHLVR